MWNWKKKETIIRNEIPDGPLQQGVKNLSLFGGDASLAMGKQNVLGRAEGSSPLPGEHPDPKPPAIPGLTVDLSNLRQNYFSSSEWGQNSHSWFDG